jgi:hypothetical protein
VEQARGLEFARASPWTWAPAISSSSGGHRSAVRRPCGPVPASTTRRTICGRIRVSSWATNPPIEHPEHVQRSHAKGVDEGERVAHQMSEDAKFALGY